MLNSDDTAETQQQAVERLSQLLYNNGCIKDLKQFRFEVQKRQEELSCELAPALLVPHAKGESVAKTAAARMKTKSGKTVILLASKNDSEHIAALAEIASAECINLK